MRVVPSCLVVALLQLGITCRPALAQERDPMRVVVQVSDGRADAGDRRRASSVIEASVSPKAWTFSFATLEGWKCGIFASHTPAGDAAETDDGTMRKVFSAWAGQVTVIKRDGDAVTFRIKWARTRDNGKPSAVGDDRELTLRPGQTLSLDLMPQSPQGTGSTACTSLSLDVGVWHWPQPDQDRRLLAVELWLVDRRQDGTELSQPLSLRGLYNQAIPFYFDSLSDGTRILDVFGELQLMAAGKTLETRITTRSRVVDSKPSPRPSHFPSEMPWPLPPYVGATTATLQLTPGEIVSIPLPPVGKPASPEAAPFNARDLSFRIRVRQLR